MQQTEQLNRQGKVVLINDEGGWLCFYKDISTLGETVILKITEEGFIKKRKQMSLLLFGGQN